MNVNALSGLGTGVAGALGTNVGSAGAFVVNGGALGTPASGDLSNIGLSTIAALGIAHNRTDQTAAMVSLFSGMAPTATGVYTAQSNTYFNIPTVQAAQPIGTVLLGLTGMSGRTSALGYNTKYLFLSSLDGDNNDTAWEVMSGHHAIMGLNNTGLSPTSSASAALRRDSLMIGCGFYAASLGSQDVLQYAQLEFGDDGSGSNWRMSLNKILPFAACKATTFRWVSGVTVAATGIYTVNGSNAYVSASTGTTGSTPPTHTSGTVSDGGVNWTYVTNIDTSLFSVDQTGKLSTQGIYSKGANQFNSPTSAGYAALFTGGSSYGTADTSSGEIHLGDYAPSQGIIAYDDSCGCIVIANTYNSNSGFITFKGRTSGTPVDWLKIGGAQTAFAMPIDVAGAITPHVDNTYGLGSSSYRWTTVNVLNAFATNGFAAGTATNNNLGFFQAQAEAEGTINWLASYAHDSSTNMRALVQHVTSESIQYVKFTGDYASGAKPWWSFDGQVSIGNVAPVAGSMLDVSGAIYPHLDNTYALGNASYRFTSVNAHSGVFDGLTIGGSAGITKTCTVIPTGITITGGAITAITGGTCS
jgi:hypothetical protein